MNLNANREVVLQFMDRAFNHGDLSAVEECLSPAARAHLEPEGVDFGTHIQQVIMGLRSAFPDLHFEFHDALAEGDIVALRSTMTGTHLGPLHLGPAPIPSTGRRISVAHMHFVRVIAGKCDSHWHLWDAPAMMQQLSAPQVSAQAAA